MSSSEVVTSGSGIKAKKRRRKAEGTEVRPRLTWNIELSRTLISVVKELGIMERFDDKKTKKASLYKRIHEYLAQLDPPILIDPVKIEQHWKFLRKKYIECKIQADKSGEASVTWNLYTDMNNLIGDRPLAQACENGVESPVPEGVDDFPLDDQQLEGLISAIKI